MTGSPKPLIAGNWKMHGSEVFAADLAGSLADRMAGHGGGGVEMLLCPPALLLGAVRAAVGASGVAIGGQDCHVAEQGAHTGDIAAAMLADAGCGYVIVGHSERRADHGETDALVKAKAEAAISAGLSVIICVGETDKERDAGKTNTVVARKIKGSVPKTSSAANTVIAYEPVWAIGTGKTPSAADVQDVHSMMRATVAEILAFNESDHMRLLYGGSVKPSNAKELMALADVDGALVGGASLNIKDFWAIAQSYPTQT